MPTIQLNLALHVCRRCEQSIGPEMSLMSNYCFDCDQDLREDSIDEAFFNEED